MSVGVGVNGQDQRGGIGRAGEYEQIAQVDSSVSDGGRAVEVM
jgi:hypothetical protein